MNVQQIKKKLQYATIGSFAASAFIGIIVVMTSSFSTITGQILSTTTLLGVFTLFSMDSIVRMEDDRPYVKKLSIIALISHFAWFLPWLLVIWDVVGIYSIVGSTVLTKLLSTAVIVSANMTLSAALLSFKKYTALVRGLAIMTIVSSAFIGVYMLIYIYSYSGVWRSFQEMWRVLIIFGILLVFGVIATPILARSAAKKDRISNLESESTPIAPDVTEAELRAQIEEEVRAEMEAEMRGEVDSGQPVLQQQVSEEQPVLRQQVSEEQSVLKQQTPPEQLDDAAAEYDQDSSAETEDV